MLLQYKNISVIPIKLEIHIPFHRALIFIIVAMSIIGTQLLATYGTAIAQSASFTIAPGHFDNCYMHATLTVGSQNGIAVWTARVSGSMDSAIVVQGLTLKDINQSPMYTFPDLFTPPGLLHGHGFHSWTTTLNYPSNVNISNIGSISWSSILCSKPQPFD